MTRPGARLGDHLDEVVFPALFRRLDRAFPEFGWVPTPDGWVATDRETTKRLFDARPDRVVCLRPFGLLVHGGPAVSWLAYLAGGAPPTGAAFVEAAREVCRRAEVPFPARDDPAEACAEGTAVAEATAFAEAEDRRRALAAVLEVVQARLAAPEAAAVREYLAARGLDASAVQALGLGHYPSVEAVRDALPRDLRPAAARARLLWRGLAGYAVVPWLDDWGRPLTLFGRWPAPEAPDGRPKTIGLPGKGTKRSPLFLDRALRAGHRDLVLVEGVLDAAVLHAHGDARVVACAGAALGRAQVATLVRRQVRSVTVCLDADAAGREGALQCVRALEGAGVAAYVAPPLPDRLDPDELVLQRGLGAWRAHVERAVSGAVHRAERLLDGVRPASSQVERDRAVGAVRELVARLPDARAALDRGPILARLAEATGVGPDALAQGCAGAPSEGGVASDGAESEGAYRAGPAGIEWVRERVGRDGQVEHELVRLSNFTARITAEVVEDDGAEARRAFELEARLGDEVRCLRVAAGAFADLEWVLAELGPRAIVEPGVGVRDRLRHAIQVLSGRPPLRRVFAHLGWATVGGAPVYLHAQGAIGAAGATGATGAAGAAGATGEVQGVHVRLDEPLDRFALPAPVEGDALREAVQASLRLLDVAPRRVVVPGLAAVFRAPLGPCDFGLFLHGTTGTGKSSLAGCLQQHWGAGLDHQNLPGSWESTSNALEVQLFAAKDALFVVDDFVPAGSAQDRARKQRDADRVLRGQGNRAGRGRLRPDASLRPARRSRALLLSTGEELPQGESLNARFLAVGVGPGDVDFARLEACQRDGRAGRLAQALAGYVRWLAGRPEVAAGAATRLLELRGVFEAPAAHRRAAEIAANLLLGLEALAGYALAAGALDPAGARALVDRGIEALREALGGQRAAAREADPLRRVFALLRSGLACGRAHVAGPDGHVPQGGGLAWGWRLAAEGRVSRPEWVVPADDPSWVAQGDRVGFVSGDDLYLDADALLALVGRLGGDEGAPVSRRTLCRRLREAGWLRGLEPARESALVRVVLGGVRRSVLHVAAACVLGDLPGDEAARGRDDGDDSVNDSSNRNGLEETS